MNYLTTSIQNKNVRSIVPTIVCYFYPNNHGQAYNEYDRKLRCCTN